MIRINALVTFRLCKLTDDELLEAVGLYVEDMYETGKVSSRHIPARPDHDFDLLVGELMVRFKDLKELHTTNSIQ